MKKFYFYFILLLFFEKVFSICKEGENFCSLCNPNTKLCQICSKEFLIPDKNGGCQGNKMCKVGINHCLECNEESNLCKTCEDRYFQDENGGCSYTYDCEISDQGTCLKCKDNFILIGNELKLCKSINSEDLKHCDKINTINGLCDSCKDGFYLNNGDKKCSNIQNCKQSSFGVCYKCETNYYLNKIEDKCIIQSGDFVHCKQTIDGKKCEICDDNYYFDEEGKCISINYCSKSSDNIKCEKCNSGYYLSEYKNSCTKEKDCYIGNRHLGICTQCKTGFYIDFNDGKCKSNEEENDFKYCTIYDNNECKSCLYGTYLGKDKKCSLAKNCLESIEGTCIQCIEGYHLDRNNKCTSIENCLDVDYSNLNELCLDCGDNFFYNRTNSLCQMMHDNFENCKITTYNGKECLLCKNNYYLNKTDNLCYSNKDKEGFYKCSYTDHLGKFCGGCEEGYYYGYIDHKCSLIEGCEISENENRCLKCDTDNNFCLDSKSGKCENNNEIESEDKKFYYRCNITNSEGTACEICVDGYSVNKNGLCSDDVHCSEKGEDGLCIKCKNFEDEYLRQCLNDEFGCVETYYDGCEECNNILDFDFCAKCSEGYELDENNICIKIDK